MVPMGDYEVELVRKQVKNFNLRVRHDGSVVASMPMRMTLAEATQHLHDKDDWIRAHRLRALVASAKARTWDDGDLLPLWGEELALCVLADAAPRTERVRRAGRMLEMHVSEAAITDGTSDHRARLFDALLATEMRDALVGLLPECEGRVGRRASSLHLSRMVSRWGSCNVKTGRIALNLALAELPPPCLEAVLCHELCHLHERGHNQRFYALLDRACPTWRDAHALLRARPPQR